MLQVLPDEDSSVLEPELWAKMLLTLHEFTIFHCFKLHRHGLKVELLVSNVIQLTCFKGAINHTENILSNLALIPDYLFIFTSVYDRKSLVFRKLLRL